MVEKVDLQRYEITGRLGSGADYDVRAAIDRETGAEVALKRPVPQAVTRRQHTAIEARTEKLLAAYDRAGDAAGLLAPLLGYTDPAIHDAFFGDDLREPYTVFVQGRALGIPLLGDMMSRFTGVPIGAGQNLFALFALFSGRGRDGISRSLPVAGLGTGLPRRRIHIAGHAPAKRLFPARARNRPGDRHRRPRRCRRPRAKGPSTPGCE